MNGQLDPDYRLLCVDATGSGYPLPSGRTPHPAVRDSVLEAASQRRSGPLRGRTMNSVRQSGMPVNPLAPRSVTVTPYRR
jgi:hypothetical protein